MEINNSIQDEEIIKSGMASGTNSRGVFLRNRSIGFPRCRVLHWIADEVVIKSLGTKSVGSQHEGAEQKKSV